VPNMKTISQKDLDKLVKKKGWELTDDSKKAMRDQKASAMLSKQVDAITKLSESVDGIKYVLKANTAKDYTPEISKLTEAIREMKNDTGSVVVQKDYKFIVKRGPDGLITEIEAVIK